MRYVRKYIDNFWFVNRVVWLTVRQNIIIYLDNEQKLGRKISEHNSNCNNLNSNTVYKHFRTIENRIDRIIDFLPLRKTCLIRTFVKAEYYKLYLDINLPINLGLAISENELTAHSWITNYKRDSVHRKFIKVN